MAKLNPSDFVQWLEKQRKDGCGYIMGSVGQYTKDLTVGSWFINQYKSNSKQYAKAKYWLKNAPRVFDCQGLADCYISEQTGKKTNVYARNNYSNWCSVKGTGMIPVDKRVPGAAVFTYSKSAGRITHVGYLIEPVVPNKPEGDWYITEARGVMHGVVRTKLLDPSRTWNRWGLMDKYFDYSSEPIKEYDFGERTMKLGMSGEDVKILQDSLILCGFTAKGMKVDGVFDEKTEKAVNKLKKKYKLEQNGKAGTKVIRILEELLPDNSDPDKKVIDTDDVATIIEDNVMIRKGPGTSYEAFAKANKNNQFDCADDKDWLCVMHNGALRWVSEKYVKDGVCTASSLNVRKGPGKGYKSIGTVKNGHKFVIVDTDGWMAIDIDGVIYWVSAKYAV